jgi:hypothetical protein
MNNQHCRAGVKKPKKLKVNEAHAQHLYCLNYTPLYGKKENKKAETHLSNKNS